MLLTKHEFFLRTNKNYREKVVAERVLAMGDLLTVLAHRSGIQFDPVTGKLSGLSKEEKAVVTAAYGKHADVEVRESFPTQPSAAPELVASVDTYLGPRSERIDVQVPNYEDDRPTDPDEDSDEDSTTSDLPELEDLHGASIGQLRAWAQQLELSPEGSKPELRDRIEAAIQSKE